MNVNIIEFVAFICNFVEKEVSVPFTLYHYGFFTLLFSYYFAEFCVRCVYVE